MSMTKKKEVFRIIPFPRMRQFSLDAGRLGSSKHIVHGLIEVDVTEPRRHIREEAQITGEKLSFTAFIVHCVGEAVHRHDAVHAHLNWRRQLVIFEDVHVNTMIEVEMDGNKVPMPHILKAVNRRSVRDLHREIRSVQGASEKAAGSRIMRWFLFLPWFVRRLFYWIVMRNPQWVRKYSSSVLVSAVGMFTSGAGWGILMPNFSLNILLGGIAEKPGVVEDRIEIREILHMTLSFDHDIVDGAPAARFTNELKELIESGYGLVESKNTAS
jgi:pyruvate/2-oxoglutarate dehydrogenase complex dihydrolipoamide acyltransferase (E2) component